MAAPRGLGIKTSIAVFFLLGVLFVMHTISSISSNVNTDSGGTSTIRNRTSHHRLVRRPHRSQSSAGQVSLIGKDVTQTEEKPSKSFNLFEEVEICKQSNVRNFLTDLQHSFLSMTGDLESKALDTKMLLDCSTDLAEIFSKLSSTAFAPMKTNFVKHINSIKVKFDVDQEKYSTIESMVMEDVRNNNQQSPTAVSDSILWLTRSLLFISELFDNFEREAEFYRAVSVAYESTIKQYHNFIIKSLFSMIAAAVPSKDTAVAAFAADPHDVTKPTYRQCLFESLAIYNEALSEVCSRIETLLQSKAGLTVMHRK